MENNCYNSDVGLPKIDHLISDESRIHNKNNNFHYSVSANGEKVIFSVNWVHNLFILTAAHSLLSTILYVNWMSVKPYILIIGAHFESIVKKRKL